MDTVGEDLKMTGRTAGKARRFNLPERIPAPSRAFSAGADASIIFCFSLLALNGGHDRIVSAFVTAGLVCASFWWCGYYTRSFAVYARDEIYYACTGVALSIIPVLLVLSGVGDMPLTSVAVALILAALGTSVLHVRLQMERRADSPPPYAGLCSVSSRAWQDRERPSFELSKRIFDVMVSFAAVAVFGPLMLLIAAAIALESRGSVLFLQERVGRYGSPFVMFKFRTMRPHAGQEWATPGDSRITKLGAWLRRTSLDELPQIFNVLRGDMSIVGPRPEMLSFAAQFDKTLENYAQRHIVRPGITGWAQLYRKRNLQPADMHTVLPYDLYYVEYSSVPLDASIVLKTAAEVLFHRAI